MVIKDLKQEKNVIIAFEGGEGSGKGTLINELKRRMLSFGIDSLFVREPGGTPISEQIRSVIVNKNNTEMDPFTEAYLFAAARNQQIKEVVLPEIGRKPIIFDRSIESNYVYQGYVRGLGENAIENINKYAMEGVKFDIIFYLDLDPKIGLNRIASNNRITNRLDLETIDFHNKVREGYLKRAKNDPRYIIIDASKTPEEVANNVFRYLGLLY